VPLTARVVDLGAPKGGVTVNFFFAYGSGKLSAPSAVTNSSGYATVTLTVTNFTANLQVNACVAPGNTPCRNIYGNAVAPAMLNLQAVSGAGQVVSGSGFQPLTVRVTDSSTPPNPVLAANVVFQSTVLRPAGNDLALASGGSAPAESGMPVILSATQSTAPSNSSGLATFTPSVGSFTGTLEVEIQVSAGTAASLQVVMENVPETYIGLVHWPMRQKLESPSVTMVSSETLLLTNAFASSYPSRTLQIKDFQSGTCEAALASISPYTL
jgi:hypothetical protein